MRILPQLHISRQHVSLHPLSDPQFLDPCMNKGS